MSETVSITYKIGTGLFSTDANLVGTRQCTNCTTVIGRTQRIDTEDATGKEESYCFDCYVVALDVVYG